MWPAHDWTYRLFPSGCHSELTLTGHWNYWKRKRRLRCVYVFCAKCMGKWVHGLSRAWAQTLPNVSTGCYWHALDNTWETQNCADQYGLWYAKYTSTRSATSICDSATCRTVCTVPCRVLGMIKSRIWKAARSCNWAVGIWARLCNINAHGHICFLGWEMPVQP